LNARWLNLKKADAQDDPLEILPDPFKKYQKNGLDLRFETRKMKDIDLDMKNWVMALFEKNMRGIYEKSKMGWNDEEKMNELLDDDAWYLIATDNETDFPRAFAHFGYDMENGDDVLFVYEIQLEECVRRKGLGKFIMKMLELMMIKTNLLRILLIVFKHNEIGNKFFKEALKYEINPASALDEDKVDTFDYEVLSRKNLLEWNKREAAGEELTDCCPICLVDVTAERWQDQGKARRQRKINPLRKYNTKDKAENEL